MRVLAEWVGVGACRMSQGKGHIISHRRASAYFDPTGMAAACPVRSVRESRIVVASSANWEHVMGFIGDRGYFVC